MAGKIKNNRYLINAPAGSGKTTYIRNKLKIICFNKPESKILCITYTNRAANELKKDLENTNITVSTIHSYINDLISPFYSHKEALDLYWEIYEKKINERIKNITDDENIKKSNQYYFEKYGELSEKTVRENLLALSYGETSFTSLYTGKLSHNDLLMFANKLIKKYPILLRKIGDKYNYIFIDEYHPWSSSFFYSSTCISHHLWNLTKTSCIVNCIYQWCQCIWSVMVCRTDLLLPSCWSCWNLYGILIWKYL